MESTRTRYGHRRGSPESHQESPLTNRTNIDFRNSALNEYKPIPNNLIRHSFDSALNPTPLARPPRQLQGKPNHFEGKPNSFDNIRNTLTELKKKIDTAKETLQSNRILSRNIIFEEPDDDEARTVELISFNESSGSQKVNNSSSLDESKKLFLEQLRKYEVGDLSRMKGYYLAEVAKALKDGSPDILNHIESNWKMLRSCGGLPEPTLQQVIDSKSTTQLANTGRKILVLGLDGTLVHVEALRTSEEAIDVVFKEGGKEKSGYLTLRPYAMTFLKKMSKVFDIVIFSDRSRVETEAILDVLDPFNEKIKLRLSAENCIRAKKVLTKDLRVIGLGLGDMLIVDHQPHSYLFQIANAVPILPFSGGSDDQLYGLEKYLLQALGSGEVREFNRGSFQLHRYAEFGSAFDVVQHLYLNGR